MSLKKQKELEHALLKHGAGEHHWNHRVIRMQDTNGEEYFEIHEVYYEKGIPRAVTVRPVAPLGVSLKELKSEMNMMRRAFKLPVLDYKDFGKKM